MPRYFFNVEYGEATQDDDSVELADLAAAKCEAVKFAGQMICDSAGDFWNQEEWKLTATNEQGLTLFCLHFVGIEAPAAKTRPDAHLIPTEPVGP